MRLICASLSAAALIGLAMPAAAGPRAPEGTPVFATTARAGLWSIIPDATLNGTELAEQVRVQWSQDLRASIERATEPLTLGSATPPASAE
jgi:hypothetical protein